MKLGEDDEEEKKDMEIVQETYKIDESILNQLKESLPIDKLIKLIHDANDDMEILHSSSQPAEAEFKLIPTYELA